MKKYLCKVWNSDRSKKKAFFCQPMIEEIIKKAQNYSLNGNRLVIETDGTDIDDNEVLEYLLKDKTIIMILNEDENWMPSGITDALTYNILDEASESSSIVTVSDDDEQNKIQPTQSLHRTLEVISPISQTSVENNAQNLDYNEMTENLQQHVLLQNEGNSSQNIDLQEVIFICADNNNTTFESTKSGSQNSRTISKMFNNFEIPWDKLSPEIIKKLNEKQMLGKHLKAFANTTVDELREISHYIPMSVYKDVAENAANKFPDSFMERDGEGNIMSQCPVGLTATMRNRNNFLNSESKKRRKDDEESTSPGVPSKKKRVSNSLARCCVSLPTVNTVESIADVNTKKQFLLSMHLKQKLSTNEEENVKIYMADCFSIQRQYFNSLQQPPNVKDILNNWPMIFRRDCLYSHFNKVMELDVSRFKNNFYVSTNKINTFFGLQNDRDERSVIRAICNYFREKDTLIFKDYKFGFTVDNVKADIEDSTPFISIVETSKGIGCTTMAYIWLGKEITAKQEDIDIMDLVLQLLCYYYVFNIVYPKAISQTFEFLMRYFFRFYPSEMRGKKLHINNMRKINSLIRKLDKVV